MDDKNNTIGIDENPINFAVRELIETINTMPNSMTNKQEHIVKQKIFDDIEKIFGLMRDEWKECAGSSAFSGFAVSYEDILKALKNELKQKSKLVDNESVDGRNASLISYLEQCAKNVDQVLKSKDGLHH